MRSTVRLDHVVKWPLLMACSNFFLTRLKFLEWYHLASSGLLLAAKALSANGCCWIGGCSGLLVRLTCHTPDEFDRLPSNTIRPFLTKLRRVALKVAMQPP